LFLDDLTDSRKIKILS